MTDFNKNLSICIPTYNGAAKVKENLEHLIPLVSKYNVAIYVSDNASTDNTREIVESFKSAYSLIFYSRNEENIGADRNFEKILKLCETRYAWLLGNDDLIVEESFELVYEKASGEVTYSLICINTSPGNGKGRVNDIPSCIFYDYNLMMQSLASHLTHMSALIFNTDVIKLCDFANYYDTWFLQTLLAYNGASRSKLPVAWLQTKGTIDSKSNSTTYSDQSFYTFTMRLYKTAQLFDSHYHLKSKKIFVRWHYKLSFGQKSLFMFLWMRVGNQINIVKYFKYLKAIRWAMPLHSRVLLFFTCLVPISVLRLLWNIRKRIKNK